MRECAPVFKRIGNLVLILALVAATGAHWAVLQSIAWTTMLASNLQHSSLADAVERTFDGKHPCCLCKQIAAGKRSEKKSDCSFEIKKLEFVKAAGQPAFSAPAGSFQWTTRANFCESLGWEPPTPPPRSIFA